MILLGFVGIWANAQVPDGFVSYEERPDILTVTPKNHPSLPESWRALKRAHLEVVAQVLELYPEHEIYFLARDAELLYDFAKLATQDESAYSKRIHLLNVSRSNVQAEHIQDYLAQEGISEIALKSGKKILFVDTGFFGTIPQTIEMYFPEELRPSFQTHLLVSENHKHPSTRVFFQALIPNATQVHPSSASVEDLIHEYEEWVPHFTDRSNRFAQVNGKWVPISPTGSASDGTVDLVIAKQYQESLAAYQKSGEGKDLFNKRRETYRKLRQLQNSPDQLKKELQAILNQEAQDPYHHALVMDFLEIEIRNYNRKNVLRTDLGIRLPGVSTELNSLSKQYPEWTWILEDPEAGISKLFEARDYTTLSAINDVTQDGEYFLVFARVMKKQDVPNAKDIALVDALIKSGKADRVMVSILSEPQWSNHPELVEILIKKGNANADIARSILSQRRWQNHPEWVEALIKSGKADNEIVQYVLSKPHWQNHPTLKARCPEGVTLSCLKAKLKIDGTCNEVLKSLTL